MTRDKETEMDDGYVQWFSSNGTNIRIYTPLAWDELELRMRDYYTERAEEYFRVRHHTDLGRMKL
jgi:hypothetical protein